MSVWRRLRSRVTSWQLVRARGSKIPDVPLAVLRYSWQDYGPVSPGFKDPEFDEIFTSLNWPIGVARFWSDTTLGLLNCTARARVFPWRVLPLNQDLFFNPKSGNIESPHSRYEIRDVALKNADPDFEIEKFGAIVIFMHPPPSDAAALEVGQATTVLDWGGEQSYMLHEVGHALMYQHDGAPDGTDYGDPYSIMSYRGCRTYADPITSDPDIPGQYYQRLGPMVSAAQNYSTLEDFKESASVVQIPPNWRDTHQAVTLRAFSEASLGDPVLAVIDVDGETWTAEYRVPTNWDQGIGTKAMVFHTIRYPPATGQTAYVRYAGDLVIPFDRGKRDWQPLFPLNQADIAAVVLHADDTTVTFSFHHRLDHAVSLQRERVDLTSTRGPMIPEKFPVWNGLCGEQEFITFWDRIAQRFKVQAEPSGYVDPAFKWRVNGHEVDPGSSITFEAPAYVDDGLSVRSLPPHAVTVSTRGTDDATPPNSLPTNEIWLENDPTDGIFDFTFEVEVSDQGPRPPLPSASSFDDQFEGEKRIISGKDEADRKCREYWDQLGKKLPGEELWKRIDKGDPVWRFLTDPEISNEERDRLAVLVAIARELTKTDPQQGRTLAGALSARLNAPQNVVIK